MLQVFHLQVFSLLDLRALLSKVNPYITIDFGVSSKTLVKHFPVSTLVDKSIVATWVYKNLLVTGSQKVTLVNHLELEMMDFYAILSMVLLNSWYTSNNCINRIIQFQFPNELVIQKRDRASMLKGHFVSYHKARKTISKGCIYHLV